MTLQAAFMFLAEGASATKHREKVSTPQMDLTVVDRVNHAEAEAETRSLTAKGLKAIELCGGFGADGVARVSKAAAGKAVVGLVRFDVHSELEVRAATRFLRADRRHYRGADILARRGRCRHNSEHP